LALGTGLGNRNRNGSPKGFEQIYDPQIHQQVTRIDWERTESSNKALLPTITLSPYQEFHRTPSVRDRESTTKARQGTRKTQALDLAAQEQDQVPLPNQNNMGSPPVVGNEQTLARTNEEIRRALVQNDG
jgi:hypothetical protein